MANKTKRLVIPNSSVAFDFVKGLREKFEITTETPEECASLFIKKNAKIALLSPFEYAINYSLADLRILPFAAISLTNNSKDSLLFFSKGVENISNVAYRKGHIYDTYLAKILFNENYKTKLSFQPFGEDEDIEKAFNKFDSLLLSGDEALENYNEKTIGLLLAEEWSLLTSLPYVSYLLVCHKDGLTLKDIDFIKDNYKDIYSGEKEEHDIENEKHNDEDDLLNDVFGADGYREDEFNDYEEENYIFDFDDTQKSSLNEYFHYLFSYSLIDDIPDLHFIE
jgi:predicted solute-binding protein